MLRLNLNGSYLCVRDNSVRSEGAHPVSFTVNYITALPVGWLTVRRALAWWPCCACAGGWSQARCSASIVFLLLWRGNEKVKDRLSNREGILLHPLHLLPVPLTVLSDRNDRARMIHMCRFSLVNHASRLVRFTNKWLLWTCSFRIFRINTRFSTALLFLLNVFIFD